MYLNNVVRLHHPLARIADHHPFHHPHRVVQEGTSDGAPTLAEQVREADEANRHLKAENYVQERAVVLLDNLVDYVHIVFFSLILRIINTSKQSNLVVFFNYQYLR